VADVESQPLTKYDCYQRAAQAPELQARFLRALHAAPRSEPLTLAEDFCGAAALSHAWLAAHKHNRAIGVDHDPEPLAIARKSASDDRLTLHRADVRTIEERADVIAVLNFSICEWKTRTELLAYLNHARSRLNRDGILVCDLYGGESAFMVGESELEVRGGLRYVWEQREADPLTGRVINAMHFHPPGQPAILDAFIYDWRLWGVPELRDAMIEAGFKSTEIHSSLGGAIDDEGALYVRPVDDPAELDESFVVSVVARL